MPRKALPALLLVSFVSFAEHGCRFGYEYPPGDGDALGGASLGGEGGEGPLGSGGAQTGAGGAGGSGGSASGGMNLGGEASGGAGGSGGAGSGGDLGTGGAQIPFGDVPYCERLHQLPSAPVVDGVNEFALPLHELSPVGFRAPADAVPPYDVMPTEVSLSYAAAFRPDGIYFFVEVTDPDYNPAGGTDPEWMGDGVELYVDHDAVFAAPGTYDFPGTYSFVIESSEDGVAEATSAGYFTPFTRQGDFTGDWISLPTVGGYVVEAFLSATDLGLVSWGLDETSALGFDLAHNVSLPVGETGSEGNRRGQYFLKISDTPGAGDEDYPYYNSNVFCTPELAIE